MYLIISCVYVRERGSRGGGRERRGGRGEEGEEVVKRDEGQEKNTASFCLI